MAYVAFRASSKSTRALLVEEMLFADADAVEALTWQSRQTPCTSVLLEGEVLEPREVKLTPVHVEVQVEAPGGPGPTVVSMDVLNTHFSIFLTKHTSPSIASVTPLPRVPTG